MQAHQMLQIVKIALSYLPAKDLLNPPTHRPSTHRSSSESAKLYAVELFTWYLIVTVLFRCPATIDLVTESSPNICKPYFQIRNAVTPYLESYYDTYAAKYVDAARPYYDTLDKRIITPATVLGTKYGAPRIAQAQAFSQAQWERNIQPQVSKYQSIAKAKYDESLGPHVNKVIVATSPYYEIARTNALQTYYGHILPTYTTVQPYVIQGYGILSNWAIETAFPYSKWAWSAGTLFLERTVWPQICILYGENVEPQLVRIGQRLGRYRDGQKVKAAVEKVERSFSATSAAPTFATMSSSAAPTQLTEQAADLPTITPTVTPTSSAQVPDFTPESEREVREKADKVVAHDLRTWQEKFAKAADEGSDDLDERMTEITERLIKNQAHGVGNALIVQLEETVKSSLKTLKTSIISIVKNSNESEDSEEELNTAVRKAGVAIKEKAQAVRTWRQSFDRETNSLISQTASDTFEILDHIRDLGLQEIGMRWAWTDGITHKDWAKYHKLKTKFDEWRYDVENVVTEHPGLGNARAASEEVENRAMEIAENAAAELSRLKETGRWKLSTGDSSDDFSTKQMPAAAAVAGQKIIQKAKDVKEAVAPSSQGTVESVVSVASSSLEEVASSISSIASSQVDNAQSAVSSVSDSILGAPQGSVESLASMAAASASSVADRASSSVLGTSQGSAESLVSIATKSASSLSAQASSSILGEEPNIVENVSESVKSAASVVSDSASHLSDVASSSISSGISEISKAISEASESLSSATSSVASSFSESIPESSNSVSSAASSASSTASEKVWGGAMAQSVEARQIIFDDMIDDSEDNTFSEKIKSMASEAGGRYAELTKAVSEALLKPSSTSGYSVPTLAAQKYSSALAAASSALYGAEQGTGESITSVASSRYVAAVSAASVIIYGTPAPLTASITSQASEAYSNALSRASENYVHARSLVSAQISGIPKPVHEQMFSSVEAAYSDSVAAANSRLQAAVSAASTAVYGAPQGTLESLSSIAQSKLSEGLSAASSRYQAGKEYVAAINTGGSMKQKLLLQIQEQYYAGVGMAHARSSEFMGAASSAIMPKPTPFHESLYNKVSAGIAGTPTHGFENALSTASMHYSSAVAEASAQLSQLLDSVTNIGGSHKEVVPTSSLAAMASSRYSAAIAEASSSYSSISSIISHKLELRASRASDAASSETLLTAAVASVASENWEALITKASEQIYGSTTPYFVTRRLLSEAKEYGAKATDAATSQYSVVQSIISELVIGKEPDFTESVFNKLSSAYYTGAGAAVSSASSYASEVYISASSVVDSVFTPPPAVEFILDAASSRVNDAVEAASIQIYGSSTGYAEAASSSIANAASSAQKVISEAIYGTPTGTIESVTSVVGDTYSSATSSAGEAYSSPQAKISSAIYGAEQGAVESAQSRLSAAVESAQVKLAEFAASVGEGASEIVKQASEGVEEFASSVSSAVGSATISTKDEL
ncbi:hypothetical protein G7Y89_g6058 [Cudoniella acicularis]|uniref:Uncharacterized protein n=1 Tax=Cudoniella acicularis TaxID=354080 RepID=A0A8H4RL86_9HELO|nr:hypothetical protein G7Y89_g6058 [Cudoniella acicularis]